MKLARNSTLVARRAVAVFNTVGYVLAGAALWAAGNLERAAGWDVEAVLLGAAAVVAAVVTTLLAQANVYSKAKFEQAKAAQTRFSGGTPRV